MSSAIIIGAGVIGLSIAWQLTRKKISVCLFDEKQAARQTSWIAAGMLAPYSEALMADSAGLAMGEQSLQLYPQFLQELTQDTLQQLPEENAGTLWVAFDRDDRQWLAQQYQLRKTQGFPIQWLSQSQVLAMEPLLSARVNAGLWIPCEKQINPPLLLTHLQQAFLSQGGHLLEHTKVSELLYQHEKVIGIRTHNGKNYTADNVIDASGAWAQQVRAVKGQILTLTMPAALTLRHMIRSRRVYLAPKQDGTVRIGATSEDLGFDWQIKAGAILDILRHAWEIVPAIAEFSIEAMNVGLRPMTAKNCPIIGQNQALGHGRSGFLLAPYTAYQIVKQIEEERRENSYQWPTTAVQR